jgi:hypothetical protein
VPLKSLLRRQNFFNTKSRGVDIYFLASQVAHLVSRLRSVCLVLAAVYGQKFIKVLTGERSAPVLKAKLRWKKIDRMIKLSRLAFQGTYNYSWATGFIYLFILSLCKMVSCGDIFHLSLVQICISPSGVSQTNKFQQNRWVSVFSSPLFRPEPNYLIKISNASLKAEGVNKKHIGCAPRK